MNNSNCDNIFESVLNEMTDSVSVLDKSGTFLFANKKVAENLCGGKPQDIIGKNIKEFVSIEQAEELINNYRKTINSCEPFIKEVKIILKEKEFWFLNRLKRIEFGIEKIESVLSISLDITEQKSIIEQINKKNRMLIRTESIANVGSWEWNIENDKVIWSKELFKIFQIEQSEYAPSYAEHANLYVSEDMVKLQKAVELCKTKGISYEIELRAIRKDGIIRICIARGQAESDSNGKIYRLVGSLQDITEQKKLQEQLIQSEKMSAIGKLTAGVAHEFNNLLAIIYGNSQIINYTAQEIKNEEIENCTKTISETIERGKSIVMNMMTFAKTQKPQKQFCNLCRLFEDVVELQKRQLNLENIIIEHNCNKKEKLENQIYVDKVQIEQVLLNILINARHALIPKNGGTIKVYCYRENKTIILCIEDNGVGIPKDKINHIFEPFFTTKGALANDNHGIKGTGLGLSVCYMIIKNHDGNIEVKSEEGKGTVFKVLLPIVDSEIRVKEKSDLNIYQQNNKTKKLSVLIIDDEVELLKTMKYLIEKFNCSVDISHNPKIGIEIAASKKFDLILLDMLLPDISGEKILKEIRKFDAITPIVFISGQIGLEIEKLKTLGVFSFIQKPFSLPDIENLLNEIRGK